VKRQTTQCRLHDRRAFIRNLAFIGAAAALTESCSHQVRLHRVPRIGFMIGAGFSRQVAAFQDQLHSLGYIEGKNIVIEMRLSQPNIDDLAGQALELTRAHVDLIVAAALPSALAVRTADSSMPMVIGTCPGMISNGFAQSLEHPGGNVTGMDELPPHVTARRLTLLKTAAPEVSRVALLSTTPGRGGHEIQLADAQQAATALGISVTPYRAVSLEQLQNQLAAIFNDGMDGLLSFQGGLALVNRQLIVDFAAEHHLPAIYQATLFAEAGGLMAWAPDLEEQFRMAAQYVDKILKGANPGDLPITQPRKYALTINARAAQRLGLTLPPALVAQAERVLS
jgi:putative ABC transport system substrate-binding protein